MEVVANDVDGVERGVANTTTRTGLTVRSEIDTNSYPKGLMVSDATFDAINIVRDDFHGDWNYSIGPGNTEDVIP